MVKVIADYTLCLLVLVFIFQAWALLKVLNRINKTLNRPIKIGGLYEKENSLVG